MLDTVPIVGGGPAGASAALSVLRSGGRAVVYEKSAFPRHKVCGEFLSPEILRAMEEIGLAADFLALGPARVTHAELHFQESTRRFRLPEPAFGLSRYALDHFLLRAAVARGAELRRERFESHGRMVMTSGRAAAGAGGRRAFGFKAHFRGSCHDAVELYFFPGGYCGVSPIEDGTTNVCGLAAEGLLRSHGFQIDRLLETLPRLKSRREPLERITRWWITGPLHYGAVAPLPSTLVAGDAACFMDPFTGSGILSAVQGGIWAGEAAIRAADGTDWSSCCEWHRNRCRLFYRRQLATTCIIRPLLSLGWAEPLAGMLPGRLLFRLTRPARLQ